MANEFNLEVTKRNLSNKGALKKLRKEGKVPGIYYSHDSKTSTPFYIEKKMLREWCTSLYYGAKKEFSSKNGPFLKIY